MGSLKDNMVHMPLSKRLTFEYCLKSTQKDRKWTVAFVQSILFPARMDKYILDLVVHWATSVTNVVAQYYAQFHQKGNETNWH